MIWKQMYYTNRPCVEYEAWLPALIVKITFDHINSLHNFMTVLNFRIGKAVLRDCGITFFCITL